MGAESAPAVHWIDTCRGEGEHMRATRLAILLTTVGLLTGMTLAPNAPALATETAPPASEEASGSPLGPDPGGPDPARPEPGPQEENDLGGAELPGDDAADPAAPVDPSDPAAPVDPSDPASGSASTPGAEAIADDADSSSGDAADGGRISPGRSGPEANLSDAPVANAVTAHDGSWMRPGWRFTGNFPDPTVLTVQESGKTVYYAYGTTTSQMRLPILRSTDLKNWYPTTYSSQPDWEKNNWNFSTRPYDSDYAKMSSNPGYYDPRKDPKIPARIRQYTYANAAGGNHPRFVQELQTFLNVDGLVSAKPSWAASYAGGDRGWNTQLSWAPGVAKIGDTYFAYLAVRAKNPGAAGVPADGAFCIALATSTKPGGPFAWANGADPIQCQPSDPGGAIDPEPVGYGGKWYLLWKGQGRPGVEQGLYAQQIDAATGKLTGKPVTLLKRNMSAGTWEQNTIENPSMATIGGTSYLLYSGGDYRAGANNTSNYATGYAVCPKGPTAPCQRPSGDNRLMRSSGELQGPGGASLFAPSGTRAKVAYHAYTRGGAQGVRTMRITNVSRLPDGTLSVNGDSSMLFVDVPGPTSSTRRSSGWRIEASPRATGTGASAPPRPSAAPTWRPFSTVTPALRSTRRRAPRRSPT